MTTTSFDLKVLTPSKTLASVTAKSVMLPGTEGYMTILPDHASMIAELGPGEVAIEGQANEHYVISGGYIEVDHNRVTILVDSIEKSNQVKN